MPPREVLVTYTLYPSGNSDLQTAVAGLRSQFPLRNLHWKPQSRTSIRTIQEVDIKFQELGEITPAKDQVSGSLLESPLVNICFVSCDDSEIYKNNTKSFIRDWLSLLAARRNVHAPLIILVNPPSAAAVSSKNVFGRDKGIIAKLRADFNTSKRDRVAQLNLSPLGTSDPTIWLDAITKLKESIVSAFGVAVFEREEEVKRGEAQRLMVGWNFCTWFLLKESLAQSFEGVNLHEDALIVYEELEATFFQVLKEQNLSWFGKLGATGPNDDSLPILDTGAKPYRILLQSSTISIFDFRVYVFARQCYLLGKLGRVTEIAKRGQWFIASLTRRLRENEADLPEHFIESWTYTACNDLVSHCDEWSRAERPSGDYSGLIAYESARAELLDISRIQVERIGVAAKHLPNEYPFEPTQPIVPISDDVLFESSDAGSDPGGRDDRDNFRRPRLSNATLLEALADGVAFRALYLKLTKKAVMAYEACGKVNSAIRLKADLAALALYMEEYRAAYDLCRALVKDCAELLTWEPVMKFALDGALQARKELQMECDEEWANLALAYIRACAVTKQEESPTIVELLNALRESPTSHDVLAKSVFETRILSNEATIAQDGLTTIDIEVLNVLQLPIKIDNVSLGLAESDGCQVVYSTGPTILVSGRNRLQASCSTSVAALFRLQYAKISLGPVTFTSQFGANEVAVKIRRDPAGLKAILRMPYEIALDAEPSVVLEVHAGTNGARGVVVEISSLADVVFVTDRAQFDMNGHSSIDGLALGDLDPGAVATIIIPYSGSPQGDFAKAQVVVHFETQALQSRTHVYFQTVFVGLPLTVNVQDFFRPNCLLSCFTVASDNREHLRINSVQLTTASKSFTVESGKKWDKSLVISPSQSLSCVFKILPMTIPTNEVLRLSIQYRTIANELQQIVQKALESMSALPPLQRAVRDLVASDDWLRSYASGGDLAASFSKADISQDFTTAFMKASETLTRWRTLEIPVDIPQRRLLTKVTLERLSPSDAIYEGRAIALDLILTTSVTWTSGERTDDLEVVFDVQASPEDWLVVGLKRGTYRVDPEQPETRPIVLVPMRPGKLALPSVTVQLASRSATVTNEDGLDRVMCETYVENAAEIVHVLPSKTTTTTLVPIQSAGWMEA